MRQTSLVGHSTGHSTVDRALLDRTLCHLGQVDRVADLGRAGPLLASGGVDSLFHCLFGRDAIRMAFDLLDDFPAVAEASLLALARLQGVRLNPRAEEEPGRILHEDRLPDDALLPELELVWSFP
jgi:glycogen debranching enzyme